MSKERAWVLFATFALAAVMLAGCKSAASSRLDRDAAVDAGEMPDPVKGSEKDRGLVGVDADQNGVRDDVDSYIAKLELDPTKRTAVVSFARESTAMMVLGGAAATNRGAALAQARRVGATIDCLRALYADDLPSKKTILQSVCDALYNNALRLRAYNHANTLVGGAVMRTGRGCDPGLTGVSR